MNGQCYYYYRFRDIIWGDVLSRCQKCFLMLNYTGTECKTKCEHKHKMLKQKLNKIDAIWQLLKAVNERSVISWRSWNMVLMVRGTWPQNLLYTIFRLMTIKWLNKYIRPQKWIEGEIQILFEFIAAHAPRKKNALWEMDAWFGHIYNKWTFNQYKYILLSSIRSSGSSKRWHCM